MTKRKTNKNKNKVKVSSSYNSISHVYQGITFRSGLEVNKWKELKRGLRYKRAIKASFESEKIPYIVKKTYTPDFIIEFKSGRKMYIEVKGYLRPEDRTKMREVRRQNPELDIRFVFARDNRLYKNSKTSYSQWCDQHGYPYAINEIPKSWLEE